MAPTLIGAHRRSDLTRLELIDETIQVSEDSLWAVRCAAYHESGHMVTAAACGLTLRSAHIYPDGTGRSDYQLCPDNIRFLNCDEKQEAQSLGDKSIISLFAGLRAQRSFCEKMGTSCSDRSESEDRKHREDLLNHLYRAEQREAKAAELKNEARILVKANWGAVEAVAEALFKERSLSGDRIGEIVKPHGINVPRQFAD